ncbi:TPA: hypothetical protein EYN65_19970 [Candidatus Poribacteria bacterium]|nr:hypothetical protein [Candidatus Poribacteria bacterium]HIP10601.1 hypothetical protein [Rhodospirillales bacterium]
MRGGSWGYPADTPCVAFRRQLSLGYRQPLVGFRCVSGSK